MDYQKGVKRESKTAEETLGLTFFGLSLKMEVTCMVNTFFSDVCINLIQYNENITYVPSEYIYTLVKLELCFMGMFFYFVYMYLSTHKHICTIFEHFFHSFCIFRINLRKCSASTYIVIAKLNKLLEITRFFVKVKSPG